jgi:hypothetical protein
VAPRSGSPIPNIVGAATITQGWNQYAGLQGAANQQNLQGQPYNTSVSALAPAQTYTAANLLSQTG